MSESLALTVKSLRFILSQIPKEEDDKVLSVLMPHYGRRFPIVALDHLQDPSQEATDEVPLVLIASRRPTE